MLLIVRLSYLFHYEDRVVFYLGFVIKIVTSGTITCNHLISTLIKT